MKKTFLFLIFIISLSYCQNEDFSNDAVNNLDIRTLERPFRMAKLNLVWAKARHRLTETKSRSLLNDLKIHEKEEFAWKSIRDTVKDKEGFKEAELRKKLIGIMSTYDLLEHFEDTQNPEKYKDHKAFSGPVDNYKNKSLFKDKKLNKLWEKAEVSGFTADELNALKEEFIHHQEKLDMYSNLLENVGNSKTKKHENAINEDEYEKFNEIMSNNENEPNLADKHNDYVHEANLLRTKHRDIKDNYDRLERIAAKGPNSEEFIEPRVQSLWRIATHSNFTAAELNSLKVELLHYESRLLKLRHMHAEQAIVNEKYKNVKQYDKHDKMMSLEDKIKKQSRKVEQIQENIEKRLFNHIEL